MGSAIAYIQSSSKNEALQKVNTSSELPNQVEFLSRITTMLYFMSSILGTQTLYL